jgi:hypothetical protein
VPLEMKPCMRLAQYASVSKDMTCKIRWKQSPSCYRSTGHSRATIMKINCNEFNKFWSSYCWCYSALWCHVNSLPVFQKNVLSSASPPVKWRE